jgi:hypothetical protein
LVSKRLAGEYTHPNAEKNAQALLKGENGCGRLFWQQRDTVVSTVREPFD